MLEYVWPVSTGRERNEVAKSGRHYFSSTPTGFYYPFDLVRKHWSKTWEAWMEWSIFFNGGIAIHATTPNHYPALGKRDSGGCVRLRRENALTLWTLLEQAGKAPVPSMQLSGIVKRKKNGDIVMKNTYPFLIVVEEYPQSALEIRDVE
jgi:hypothetical protein